MFRSALIIYKPTDKCFEIARSFSNEFKKQGIQITVYTVNDIHFLGSEKYDLILSVGGDGTFLKVSRLLQKCPEMPLILPYPCGRRNTFYESLSLSIKDIVRNVLDGMFRIEFYPRLRVCVKETCMYFLNEIALININLGKIAKYDINIQSHGTNNSFSFEGDGVLVSSASGSAAYNLSAGGPLVDFTSNLMIFTPLNPLQRDLPSIVLPSILSKVEIYPKEASHMFIDGENMGIVERDVKILITGGSNYIRIIRFGYVRNLVKNILETRRAVI